MISNQILQTTIEDLKSITRIDLCITDTDGERVATTYDSGIEIKEMIQTFVDSPADSQIVQDFHFFKIFDDVRPEYVLVAKGASDDVYMIGKITVCQIQSLITAYKERYDKNNFIQNLLLDNLLLIDIYNRAKKLHIEVKKRRIVFMIETKYEKDSNAMETVKGIYAGRPQDFITAVDEKNIILVRQLSKEEEIGDMERVAHILVDMLNTEAMTTVRISYGTVVEEMKDISKSFKEAKMALDVGKIFYKDKGIIAYNSLGIGRLIYQLPQNLCEMFMKEIFHGTLPHMFDEETFSTIHKFFDNNLNVSETARQLFVHRNTLVYRLEKIEKQTGLDIRVFDDALTFKIALMVVSYMKYMKDN